MNRVDRLHAILTVLQSKRIVRAEDLATRFEISIRTVYRDIRALEEGGIPIGAEAGVGYFLTEGFHLPPVMFTNEEARTLLLAGKFIEKLSDASINSSFVSAITKIRAVLDNDKKDELDGLEHKIAVLPFSPGVFQTEDLQINPIKQALANNNVLRLEYKSGKDESSERIVEPVGLCYYSAKWHLIAYCRLRNDYRDFRLDRITKFNLLSERFMRIKHPSLQEYLDKMSKELELIPVRIKVNISVLPHIQDSKYHMGHVEEERIGDEMLMTFSTMSLSYFSRWLLSFGLNAEVIYPEALKVEMKNLVTDLSQRYL